MLCFAIALRDNMIGKK